MLELIILVTMFCCLPLIAGGVIVIIVIIVKIVNNNAKKKKLSDELRNLHLLSKEERIKYFINASQEIQFRLLSPYESLEWIKNTEELHQVSVDLLAKYLTESPDGKHSLLALSALNELPFQALGGEKLFSALLFIASKTSLISSCRDALRLLRQYKDPRIFEVVKNTYYLSLNREKGNGIINDEAVISLGIMGDERALAILISDFIADYKKYMAQQKTNNKPTRDSLVSFPSGNTDINAEDRERIIDSLIDYLSSGMGELGNLKPSSDSFDRRVKAARILAIFYYSDNTAPQFKKKIKDIENCIVAGEIEWEAKEDEKTGMGGVVSYVTGYLPLNKYIDFGDQQY